MGCRRGCGVIIPPSLHTVHPSFLPSCTSLARSLSSTHTHTHKPTPTPQILRDSRYASQCPPRHRTHSLQYARSHQPVSNREYGCITNATARLCGTGGPAQVRSRNNEGNFQNRNREYKKKKKKLVHTHTKLINHPHLTLADTLLPSPPIPCPA